MPFSTYCQICGLPCSWVRVIPYGEDDVPQFRVLHQPEPDFSLDSPAMVDLIVQEKWLTSVLGVSEEDDTCTEVGVVDNGDLIVGGETVGDVADEGDDLLAVHSACWKLKGDSPWSHVRKTVPYREFRERFHGQYFDFDKLIEEGNDWMMADPLRENNAVGFRNKERILAWLASEGIDEVVRPTRIADIPDELPSGFTNITLYEWLAIPEVTNDAQVIQRSFRRMQRMYHPNASTGNAEKYEEAQIARDILSNPIWREIYASCDFAYHDQRQRFIRQVWWSAKRNLC